MRDLQEGDFCGILRLKCSPGVNRPIPGPWSLRPAGTYRLPQFSGLLCWEDASALQCAASLTVCSMVFMDFFNFN